MPRLRSGRGPWAPDTSAPRAGAALAGLALLFFGAAHGAHAQQPVTRAQAVAAALAGGPRAALAAPDLAAARAELTGARAFQNPTALLSHTGSVPTSHAEVEIPLDFPWLRSARVGAAQAGLSSARLRVAFERAAARYDAEAAYVTALAASERARLSRRNATDADSLLRLARLRRDAGDASELDVELATVSAGQLAAAGDADSLGAIAALLELQRVMGLGSELVTITLLDSLAAPPGAGVEGAPATSDAAAATPGAAAATPGAAVALGSRPPAPSASSPLLVAAADASLQSAERALAFARRSVFPAPSLTLGAEGGDPSGVESGPLAIVGVSFPLPLFNWNGAAIQAATAARDRARVEAEVARRASDAAIAAARRELAAALRRVDRDRDLVASADRVAAMALVAYGAGAAALPNALEAQRTARQALADYVNDLAAANVAEAALRLVRARAGP
jgi:outer membrane protein, heavy metal efflux system